MVWRGNKGKNNQIQRIAKIIMSEIRYEPTSFWDDSNGGYGRYLWGYHTRSPGPGMSITPDHAYAEMVAKIRTAIVEFEDVFEFVPTEINIVRVDAIIRLLYYMGLPRFMRMTTMIAAIFKGTWEEAAYQLRDSNWYEQNHKKAKCIHQELRDGSYCPHVELEDPS